MTYLFRLGTIVFILASLPCFSFGQVKELPETKTEPPQVSLPPNTIGVVHLIKTLADKYQLEIEFPEDQMRCQKFSKIYEINRSLHECKNPVGLKIHGFIKLFDSKGILGEIQGVEKIPIVFFCENDGGIHYHPAIKLEVMKKALRRRLISVFFTDTTGGSFKTAAFALVNFDPSEKLEPYIPAKTHNPKILLTGSLIKNGKTIAALVTKFTTDSSGTPLLDESWTSLETSRGEFMIGCPEP